MAVINKSREAAVPEGGPAGWAEQITRGVANTVGGAEQALLPAGTRHVYQFRQRHPWLYGIIAFILGGGLVAVFMMTTYSNWAYESIDLKAALYQVVFGGLGGGIVTIILAFLYADALRNTLSAQKLVRPGGPSQSP